MYVCILTVTHQGQHATRPALISARPYLFRVQSVFLCGSVENRPLTESVQSRLVEAKRAYKLEHAPSGVSFNAGKLRGKAACSPVM